MKRFFKAVRSFYTEVVNKMLKSLPLSNQLLKDIVIIDPKLMQEVSTEAVVHIARALPHLHIEDLDKLKDEFLEYQLEEENNLANFEGID